MMRLQNKETFKSILLMSCMVLCLFLTGCRDKSVDHYNRGFVYHKKGEYNRAISYYTKAIKPGFPIAEKADLRYNMSW